MKKFIIGLMLILCLSSCYHQINNDIIENDSTYINTLQTAEQESAQMFFNCCIRENHIKNKDGHDIILYECGRRGLRNYSFSIEHSPNCQKCYEYYD